MLVPKFLREAKPDCNIGWFLHTPFPSAEIYRTLPWRQEIIESLLHANLLGFHAPRRVHVPRRCTEACVPLAYGTTMGGTTPPMLHHYVPLFLKIGLKQVHSFSPWHLRSMIICGTFCPPVSNSPLWRSQPIRWTPRPSGAAS